MGADATISVIGAAVGAGAPNRPADVRTVQHLLNRCGAPRPGPENGQADSALTQRIRWFQVAALEFKRPDGRIDPGGRTIAALLRRAARSRAAPAPRPAPSIGERLVSGLSSLTDALRNTLVAMFRSELRSRQVVRQAVPNATPSGAPQGGGALTAKDYEMAAARLGSGIEPGLLRAFAEVESSGKPALGANELPIIAYEGHIFRRYTKRRFDRDYPLLSYKYVRKAGREWRANNKTQKTAWATLMQAMELDRDPALMACSWGMFQVMGFNYQTCGYRDVTGFVAAMKQGAAGQVDAFVGFCRSTAGLVAAMQRADYATMARLYNGTDYGDYDRRIRNAHARYKGK